MIHIFQRHCWFSPSSVSKIRPEWFSREKCFQNLKNTIVNDNRVKLTLVYDNAEGPLERHFISTEKHYEIVEFTGGDDSRSLYNLLHYIIEQDIPDEDIVYVLEDDYVHRKGWVDIMLEGFNHTDAKYVTLYDHRDKYFLHRYRNLKSKIVFSPSVHWRYVPSTTNTWSTKFKTLKKHFKIHEKFCKSRKGIARDNAKFNYLTKNNFFLISPIPAYSTHAETPFLSPVIDWEKVINENE
ncbi:MAG TPA: hypothetical protein ENK25_05005 [Bacteroidetes bacterium]|nr:hypothetical protein [Bacteroidota bacterium]